MLSKFHNTTCGTFHCGNENLKLPTQENANSKWCKNLCKLTMLYAHEILKFEASQNVSFSNAQSSKVTVFNVLYPNFGY